MELRARSCLQEGDYNLSRVGPLSVGVLVCGAIAANGVNSPTATAWPACAFDLTTRSGQEAYGSALLDATNRVNATHSLEDLNALNSLTYSCIKPGQALPQLPPEPLPTYNPGPPSDVLAQPEPVPAAPAPQPPSANGQCQQLNDAWSHLDGVLPFADRFAELRKVPGLSAVSAMQLVGCGISDIPVALMNPSRENQSDMFSGFCNGATAMIPLPIGDPCGNTPAG